MSGTVVAGLPAGHKYQLRRLGAVNAKGKTQSVDIYECYDNDADELANTRYGPHRSSTAAMDEFRKGMLLTAGKIFARIAEMNPDDTVAAYFRDRCTLAVISEREPGRFDGAEKMEAK